MLQWILLHLAIYLLTSARNAPPTNTGTVVPMNKPHIKHIDSCPDVGYFFRRESVPNAVAPAPCYLCFCHGEKLALCWERDNKRCDSESFHYHGIGKRNTRIRRSPNPDPFGLSDIFFRDAARSFFNKEPEQQCKPHESSFSEGCPPADWCTGCTVCDCNANGQWDCHTLSFCPDNKNTKKAKKGVQRISPTKPKKQPNTTTKRNSVRTTKRTPAKRIIKPYVPLLGLRRVVNQANQNKKPQPGTRVVKKIISKKITKKPNVKSPTKYWKPGVSQKNIDSKNTARPKFINRYKATPKPVKVKRSPSSQIQMNENQQNETFRIAQEIFKRVMTAVKKLVGNQMKNLTNQIYESTQNLPAKNIGKRHINEEEIKIQRKLTKKNKGPAKKYVIRNKRDILAVINIENCTVQEVTESPSIFNVSDTTEETISTTSIQTSADQEFLRNSNPSEYYNYVVGINQTTTDSSIAINSVYRSETVLNLMSTERMRNLDQYENKNNSLDALTYQLPTGNDLKFDDWSYLKTLKERHLKNETISSDGDNIDKAVNETNEELNHKNKVHSKDVERKLLAKKYNVVKVVTTHRSLFDKNQTKIHQSINNKMNDLHKTVRKLFKNFYRSSRTKTDTMTKKKRYKKSGLIKYMKNFLNKIFQQKHCKSEQQLIESLCDTFGPCKLSKNDKMILKLKLKDLNRETVKILETIKIIKGLLNLLDIPITNVNESKSLENDLRKLDSILKGMYHTNDSYVLSYSQLTQIDYIKKNTQYFIQSVGKFAKTLNSIVTVITKHKNNNTNTIHHILKNLHKKEASVNTDPFKRLRNLLTNYNLVQNSFMRKINNVLNDFENNIKGKKETKVSDDDSQNLNNTVAIEIFSSNIINNLRRLKNVAQTQTSKGRNKREIPRAQRDDESFNYLLMLMEYLMKQSHPLSDAPVNDGIDLLIEAIKNAPDIKSIKKKVLLNTPAPLNNVPTHTVQLELNKINSTSHYKDEKNVQSNTDSNDDNELVVKEPSLGEKQKLQHDENKHSETIFDEDKEDEEKVQVYRKIDTKTESGYFKTIDDSIENETINDIDNTTQRTSFLSENNVNGEILDYDNLYKIKSVIGDNYDKSKEDVSKRDNNEIDGDDYENKVGKSVEIKRKNKDKMSNEDELASSFYNEVETKAVLIPSVDSSVTREPSADTELTEVAVKNDSLDESEGRLRNKHMFDIKSPIDWIEENFALDPKTNSPVAISTLASTTEAVKATTVKIEITNSGMTNEMMNAEEKKKSKEINTEDVIFRKQMELLNSLDYGTERAESDDLDSKDERSASDSFSTYF